MSKATSRNNLQRSFVSTRTQPQRYVLCDDCKTNDDKLAQTINKTDKVKKKNNKLRNELREISKTLDENLEKMQQKNLDANKSFVDPEKRIKILQQELENAQLNLKMYKKQYNKLKLKIDGGYNVEKISGMLRIIDNRKHELNEVQVENKSLNRLKRESDRVLAKVNPDQILNRLKDEILMTKDLIKEGKKTERVNEKNFKKQQEYITKLDLKHREVCDRVGADYEVLKPTKEELFPQQQNNMNKSTISALGESKKTKLNKSRQPLYVNPNHENSDIEEKDMDLTWDKFNDFQNKINILEKYIKVDDEKTTKFAKSYQYKQDQVLKENEYIDEQIQKREQELEILIQKLKDLRNLENSKSDRPGSRSSNYYLSKAPDQKQILKRGREIRYAQAGIEVNSNSAHSFKDASHLPESKDYQVREVRIIHSDDYVFSLEILYQYRNGDKEVITCFKNAENSKDKSKLAVLKLKGTEHIAQIQGYYNATHIEYLKIISTRGNYLMAGNERNLKNAQQFFIDIQKNEKPISFYGTVDKVPKIKKNKERQDQYCLVAIGVELRKKDALQPLLKQDQKKESDDEDEIIEEDEDKEKDSKQKEDNKNNDDNGGQKNGDQENENDKVVNQDQENNNNNNDNNNNNGNGEEQE